MIKAINECKTVAELLADKSRWTTGWFARDRYGYETVYAKVLEAGI